MKTNIHISEAIPAIDDKQFVLSKALISQIRSR